MKTRFIIGYALVAVAVIVLGALAGWFFFLRTQTTATSALNAARGFGAQTPSGTFGTAASSFASSSAQTGTGTTTKPPQLWHVTTTPVGGAGFATSTQGTHLRYAERATGYVFEADPTNSAIVRLTNTLMPKIYEAAFASQGRVIERSVGEGGIITTYAGRIDTSTSTPLTGTFLPTQIKAFAPNPSADQILYLEARRGGIVALTAAWNGGKQAQIFSSPLSDWRAWWLLDGRIIIAQKASDSLMGYAYTLKSGASALLLGPLPGLTVLPRSGSQAILYGTSDTNGLALFARLSGTTTTMRLPIATAADKCVWAPGVSLVAYCAVPRVAPQPGFLGEWYRGEIHTSDAIWRVDASAGQARLIFAPASGAEVDVVNPVIDNSGTYLAFMNASDESLWLLRLQ
jgi:uncharacterized membrane protein